MAIKIAPQEPVSSEGRNLRFDGRALLRLSAWGGAAALSLGALAITSQTEGGSARLQNAIVRMSQPEVKIASVHAPPRVIGINPDNLRLEAQVRVLAADRDRLAARLASLEHSLDDMTGSIKKQPAEAPVAKPPALKAPIIAPLAMPAITGTIADWPGAAAAPAAAATTETVPLPPTRVAIAPADENADELPRKPELGIDLGGASNLDVLHARWVAVKANFGPLLTGLHPLVGQNTRPGGTNYRLLVGPVPNAAAAANLCARFAAARVNCRTAKFDGEQMAKQ